VPSSFGTRLITIAACTVLPFVESEWADSIVVVHRGEVVLETDSGMFSWFEGGDILALGGMSLCALHNHGDEPTVLLAISRSGIPDDAGAGTNPGDGEQGVSIDEGGDIAAGDETRPP
jgi:hypothetical protein